MRMMSYRLEMKDGDRYAICNADVSWHLMPQAENYQAPAVSIKGEPFPKGHVNAGEIVNIDDYIKPFFSEDTDPELKDNYLRAIHGELKGWKLIAVCIEKNHIELTVGKDEEHYDTFEVTAAPRLRFNIESPTFGGKMTKYLVEAWMEDPNGLDPMNNKAYTKIIVTEYDDFSKRRLIFNNNAPFDVQYTRAEWIEVSVIEYC